MVSGFRDWIIAFPCHTGKSLLWMSISWVFSRKNIFARMMELAIKECTGPIESLDLPYPQAIISERDFFRYLNVADESKGSETVAQALAVVDDLYNALRSYDDCSFECSATLVVTFD
jgi:hypothetical protein